jgi:hypothetical protein
MKITIAELDLDSTALVKAAAENKKTIEGLKASLDGLRDSEGKITAAYVTQEAQIKKLSSEYTAQKNVIAAVTDSTGKLEKVNVALTNTINKEITSIAAARKNNSDLLKVRNELNLATVEGKDALDDDNKKLNENNAFIKANVSDREKQVLGIGDYARGITEAAQALGLESTELRNVKAILNQVTPLFQGFTQMFADGKKEILDNLGALKSFGATNKESAAATGEQAEATTQLSAAQKAYTIGTGIATGATRIFAVALAATGITLIIAAVALLINYFRQFDPVVDKIEQAFAGLKAVIDVITEAVGSFVSSISSVGDLMDKLGNFFEDPIGSMKSFGKELGEAAKKAAELKARQQDLADQQDINSIANKKQESEIARLLIQSRDRSKSVEEQAALFAKAEKLNADIFERTKKLAAEEMAIAIESAANIKKLNAEEIRGLREKGIAYANELLNKGRLRQDDYDALKKAYEAEIDIENQRNEQLDKITTKKNNAIEKAEAAAEAAAKKAEETRQKILDETIKRTKLELDLFIQAQGIRAKSMAEGLAFAEVVFNRRMKIAEAEFNATKKTETDRLAYLKAQNDARLEFLRAQQSAAADNVARELQIFNDQNKSLIDGKKFLNDELLALEQDRLNKTAEAEAAFATERLRLGVINQQQYADAIAEIDRKQREANDAVIAEREAAEKEKQAIDLENKRAEAQLLFEDEFATRAAQIELQQKQELEAAQKNGANVDLINKKFAAQKKVLDKDVADFKLAQEIGLVQGLRGLVNEQSQLGKALALAEVVMTTIKNATAAFEQAALFSASGNFPLAANASVQGGIIVATGAAQAAKIAGVKFEKGGIGEIHGPSHAAGGVPIYVGGQYAGEAQGGEGFGILNRGAYAAWMAFNDRFGDGAKSGGGFMAGGGILTQVVQSSGATDVGAIMDATVELIRNMPAPRVAVDEIREVAGNYATIEDGANF